MRETVMQVYFSTTGRDSEGHDINVSRTITATQLTPDEMIRLNDDVINYTIERLREIKAAQKVKEAV
jgi:hypothetical protein